VKKIIKLIAYLIVLKFVVGLFNENSSIKEQIDKLKEEITNLEINDLDKKIKDFQNKIDGFKDKNQES
jgi:septation ring formation regulator EzrA